jgi:hypothetical protein
MFGLRTAPVVNKIIVVPEAMASLGAPDKVATLVVGFQLLIVDVPLPVSKLEDVMPTCILSVPPVVRVSVVPKVLPVTVVRPVVIGGDAREVCTAPVAEAPEAAEGAEYTLLFAVIVIGFTEPGENPEKVAEYGVDV